MPKTLFSNEADFASHFRDAMAQLSSAICVVTSNGEAGQVGLTVSSVSSVTDAPPTVLFCINQNSQLHDILLKNGQVCINVLNHAQTDLAKHFAAMLDSTMEERFSWDIWTQSASQQWMLKEAIAAMPGKIIDHHHVGSHTIFIVELDQIQHKPNDSLVYFDRQFKAMKR